MSLVTLPMYDLPELRPATDALWAAIAARLRLRGVAAPENLSRGDDLLAMWMDPLLLLAQTCGYPLVTSLAGSVCVVATPCYLAEGCEGPLYRSAVVVRATDTADSLADLRGRRCAVNDAASNSGMNVLRAAIAPLAEGSRRFFAEIAITGSHVASVAAVGNGQADVAAIDCVTWAHLRRWRSEATSKLRVLAWTQATAGLPLITARDTPEATLRALVSALDHVASNPGLADIRAILLLSGFASLAPDTYGRVLEIKRAAEAAGYPVLQ